MYLPGLSDNPQDDLGIDSPIDPIKKIAENEVKKQRTLELAIVMNIYPHKSGKDNIAVKTLEQMQEKRAAKIFDAMQPDAAARLKEKISRLRYRDTAPEVSLR